MAYIRPPILTGSAEQQLRALRDYLFQLAGQLNEAESASEAAPAAQLVRSAQKAADASVRKSAEELRALIIKSAGEVEAYTDRRVDSFASSYVSRSDFGVYAESTQSSIEQTARGVTEAISAVMSVQTDVDGVLAAVRTINGEIRRGLITDPTTGETVTGIAVAENLRFTGTQQTIDGQVYYELSPGQTLGIYTATGWQFWINGVKVGWFSALDGMLHVAHVAVEAELTIGGNWTMSASGGFGLRVL